MRRMIIVASAGVALVLLAACGGGSSKKDATPAGGKTAPANATSAAPTKAPAATTPGASAAAGSPQAGDETAFARSMVLQIGDFPQGWIVTASSQTNETSPLDAVCGTPAEEGSTGRAVSGDFAADASGTTISESVITFADADAASAALAKIPDYIACAVQAVNDGKIASLSNAQSSDVSVDVPGNEHHAYQLTMDLDTGQPNDTEKVYFLLVYVRDGRVGYSLSGTNFGGPYDMNTMTSTASLAQAKIKQQP